MKSFLATTAIVLLMGGAAYAAPAQFNAYRAQASDIDASKFIGQTVYATNNEIDANQPVASGAEKDWNNVGDINEVVLGRDGMVKAVVLGVGGFLGMGEKNVAVPLQDIKFVKNGDSPNDYFLVINATKEALNAAPSYRTPDEIRAAGNADNPATTTTDTAANPTMNAPADTANNQASSTMTPNNGAAGTDETTTSSTTNNGAVQTTMDENRARLTPPTVTREGYQTAQISELTADKLEGARVYGPKDEDVGEINRLVMNDNGKGIKLFVLDVGGFLGIGEHQIAVTPQELNIVRNANGDDVRVYIDANKQALKAQPEYKTQ